MDERTGGAVDPLRIELYKSLRSELVSYLEKIPALWLQKFALTGAVVAFIVSKHSDLVNGGLPLSGAFLTIPILAILLDVKITEYALHARAISAFITLNYIESSTAISWEQTLWGTSANSSLAGLVKARSIATVAVTTIPTMVLIVLAGAALDQVNGTHPWGMVIAISTSVLYLATVIFTATLVWPTLTRKSAAA